MISKIQYVKNEQNYWFKLIVEEWGMHRNGLRQIFLIKQLNIRNKIINTILN